MPVAERIAGSSSVQKVMAGLLRGTRDGAAKQILISVVVKRIDCRLSASLARSLLAGACVLVKAKEPPTRS